MTTNPEIWKIDPVWAVKTVNPSIDMLDKAAVEEAANLFLKLCGYMWVNLTSPPGRIMLRADKTLKLRLHKFEFIDIALGEEPNRRKISATPFFGGYFEEDKKHFYSLLTGQVIEQALASWSVEVVQGWAPEEDSAFKSNELEYIQDSSPKGGYAKLDVLA